MSNIHGFSFDTVSSREKNNNKHIRGKNSKNDVINSTDYVPCDDFSGLNNGLRAESSDPPPLSIPKNKTDKVFLIIDNLLDTEQEILKRDVDVKFLKKMMKRYPGRFEILVQENEKERKNKKRHNQKNFADYISDSVSSPIPSSNSPFTVSPDVTDRNSLKNVKKMSNDMKSSGLQTVSEDRVTSKSFNSEAAVTHSNALIPVTLPPNFQNLIPIRQVTLPVESLPNYNNNNHINSVTERFEANDNTELSSSRKHSEKTKLLDNKINFYNSSMYFDKNSVHENVRADPVIVDKANTKHSYIHATNCLHPETLVSLDHLIPLRFVKSPISCLPEAFLNSNKIEEHKTHVINESVSSKSFNPVQQDGTKTSSAEILMNIDNTADHNRIIISHASTEALQVNNNIKSQHHLDKIPSDSLISPQEIKQQNNKIQHHAITTEDKPIIAVNSSNKNSIGSEFLNTLPIKLSPLTPIEYKSSPFTPDATPNLHHTSTAHVFSDDDLPNLSPPAFHHDKHSVVNNNNNNNSSQHKNRSLELNRQEYTNLNLSGNGSQSRNFNHSNSTFSQGHLLPYDSYISKNPPFAIQADQESSVKRKIDDQTDFSKIQQQQPFAYFNSTWNNNNLSGVSAVFDNGMEMMNPMVRYDHQLVVDSSEGLISNPRDDFDRDLTQSYQNYNIYQPQQRMLLGNESYQLQHYNHSHYSHQNILNQRRRVSQDSTSSRLGVMHLSPPPSTFNYFLPTPLIESSLSPPYSSAIDRDETVEKSFSEDLQLKKVIMTVQLPEDQKSNYHSHQNDQSLDSNNNNSNHKRRYSKGSHSSKEVGRESLREATPKEPVIVSAEHNDDKAKKLLVLPNNFNIDNKSKKNDENISKKLNNMVNIEISRQSTEPKANIGPACMFGNSVKTYYYDIGSENEFDASTEIVNTTNNNSSSNAVAVANMLQNSSVIPSASQTTSNNTSGFDVHRLLDNFAPLTPPPPAPHAQRNNSNPNTSNRHSAAGKEHTGGSVTVVTGSSSRRAVRINNNESTIIGDLPADTINICNNNESQSKNIIENAYDNVEPDSIAPSASGAAGASRKRRVSIEENASATHLYHPNMPLFSSINIVENINSNKNINHSSSAKTESNIGADFKSSNKTSSRSVDKHFNNSNSNSNIINVLNVHSCSDALGSHKSGFDGLSINSGITSNAHTFYHSSSNQQNNRNNHIFYNDLDTIDNNNNNNLNSRSHPHQFSVAFQSHSTSHPDEVPLKLANNLNNQHQKHQKNDNLYGAHHPLPYKDKKIASAATSSVSFLDKHSDHDLSVCSSSSSSCSNKKGDKNKGFSSSNTLESKQFVQCNTTSRDIMSSTEEPHDAKTDILLGLKDQNNDLLIDSSDRNAISTTTHANIAIKNNILSIDVAQDDVLFPFRSISADNNYKQKSTLKQRNLASPTSNSGLNSNSNNIVFSSILPSFPLSDNNHKSHQIQQHISVHHLSHDLPVNPSMLPSDAVVFQFGRPHKNNNEVSTEETHVVALCEDNSDVTAAFTMNSSSGCVIKPALKKIGLNMSDPQLHLNNNSSKDTGLILSSPMSSEDRRVINPNKKTFASILNLQQELNDINNKHTLFISSDAINIDNTIGKKPSVKPSPIIVSNPNSSEGFTPTGHSIATPMNYINNHLPTTCVDVNNTVINSLTPGKHDSNLNNNQMESHSNDSSLSAKQNPKGNYKNASSHHIMSSPSFSSGVIPVYNRRALIRTPSSYLSNNFHPLTSNVKANSITTSNESPPSASSNNVHRGVLSKTNSKKKSITDDEFNSPRRLKKSSQVMHTNSGHHHYHHQNNNIFSQHSFSPPSSPLMHPRKSALKNSNASSHPISSKKRFDYISGSNNLASPLDTSLHPMNSNTKKSSKGLLKSALRGGSSPRAPSKSNNPHASPKLYSNPNSNQNSLSRNNSRLSSSLLSPHPSKDGFNSLQSRNGQLVKNKRFNDSSTCEHHTSTSACASPTLPLPLKGQEWSEDFEEFYVDQPMSKLLADHAAAAANFKIFKDKHILSDEGSVSTFGDSSNNFNSLSFDQHQNQHPNAFPNGNILDNNTECNDSSDSQIQAAPPLLDDDAFNAILSRYARVEERESKRSFRGGQSFKTGLQRQRSMNGKMTMMLHHHGVASSSIRRGGRHLQRASSSRLVSEYGSLLSNYGSNKRVFSDNNNGDEDDDDEYEDLEFFSDKNYIVKDNINTLKNINSNDDITFNKLVEGELEDDDDDGTETRMSFNDVFVGDEDDNDDDDDDMCRSNKHHSYSNSNYSRGRISNEIVDLDDENAFLSSGTASPQSSNILNRMSNPRQSFNKTPNELLRSANFNHNAVETLSYLNIDDNENVLNSSKSPSVTNNSCIRQSRPISPQCNNNNSNVLSPSVFTSHTTTKRASFLIPTASHFAFQDINSPKNYSNQKGFPVDSFDTSMIGALQPNSTPIGLQPTPMKTASSNIQTSSSNIPSSVNNNNSGTLPPTNMGRSSGIDGRISRSSQVIKMLPHGSILPRDIDRCNSSGGLYSKDVLASYSEDEQRQECNDVRQSRSKRTHDEDDDIPSPTFDSRQKAIEAQLMAHRLSINATEKVLQLQKQQQEAREVIAMLGNSSRVSQVDNLTNELLLDSVDIDELDDDQLEKLAEAIGEQDDEWDLFNPSSTLLVQNGLMMDYDSSSSNDNNPFYDRDDITDKSILFTRSVDSKRFSAKGGRKKNLSTRDAPISIHINNTKEENIQNMATSTSPAKLSRINSSTNFHSETSVSEFKNCLLEDIATNNRLSKSILSRESIISLVDSHFDRLEEEASPYSSQNRIYNLSKHPEDPKPNSYYSSNNNMCYNSLLSVDSSSSPNCKPSDVSAFNQAKPSALNAFTSFNGSETDLMPQASPSISIPIQSKRGFISGFNSRHNDEQINTINTLQPSNDDVFFDNDEDSANDEPGLNSSPDVGVLKSALKKGKNTSLKNQNQSPNNDAQIVPKSIIPNISVGRSSFLSPFIENQGTKSILDFSAASDGFSNRDALFYSDQKNFALDSTNDDNRTIDDDSHRFAFDKSPYGSGNGGGVQFDPSTSPVKGSDALLGNFSSTRNIFHGLPSKPFQQSHNKLINSDTTKHDVSLADHHHNSGRVSNFDRLPHSSSVPPQKFLYNVHPSSYSSSPVAIPPSYRVNHAPVSPSSVTSPFGLPSASAVSRISLAPPPSAPATASSTLPAGALLACEVRVKVLRPILPSDLSNPNDPSILRVLRRLMSAPDLFDLYEQVYPAAALLSAKSKIVEEAAAAAESLSAPGMAASYTGLDIGSRFHSLGVHSNSNKFATNQLPSGISNFHLDSNLNCLPRRGVAVSPPHLVFGARSSVQQHHQNLMLSQRHFDAMQSSPLIANQFNIGMKNGSIEALSSVVGGWTGRSSGFAFQPHQLFANGSGQHHHFGQPQIGNQTGMHQFYGPGSLMTDNLLSDGVNDIFSPHHPAPLLPMMLTDNSKKFRNDTVNDIPEASDEDISGDVEVWCGKESSSNHSSCSSQQNSALQLPRRSQSDLHSKSSPSALIVSTISNRKRPEALDGLKGSINQKLSLSPVLSTSPLFNSDSSSSSLRSGEEPNSSSTTTAKEFAEKDLDVEIVRAAAAAAASAPLCSSNVGRRLSMYSLSGNHQPISLYKEGILDSNAIQSNIISEQRRFSIASSASIKTSNSQMDDESLQLPCGEFLDPKSPKTAISINGIVCGDQPSPLYSETKPNFMSHPRSLLPAPPVSSLSLAQIASLVNARPCYCSKPYSLPVVAASECNPQPNNDLSVRAQSLIHPSTHFPNFNKSASAPLGIIPPPPLPAPPSHPSSNSQSMRRGRRRRFRADQLSRRTFLGDMPSLPPVVSVVVTQNALRVWTSNATTNGFTGWSRRRVSVSVPAGGSAPIDPSSPVANPVANRRASIVTTSRRASIASLIASRRGSAASLSGGGDPFAFTLKSKGSNDSPVIKPSTSKLVSPTHNNNTLQPTSPHNSPQNHNVSGRTLHLPLSSKNDGMGRRHSTTAFIQKISSSPRELTSNYGGGSGAQELSTRNSVQRLAVPGHTNLLNSDVVTASGADGSNEQVGSHFEDRRNSPSVPSMNGSVIHHQDSPSSIVMKASSSRNNNKSLNGSSNQFSAFHDHLGDSAVTVNNNNNLENTVLDPNNHHHDENKITANSNNNNGGSAALFNMLSNTNNFKNSSKDNAQLSSSGLLSANGSGGLMYTLSLSDVRRIAVFNFRSEEEFSCSFSSSPSSSSSFIADDDDDGNNIDVDSLSASINDYHDDANNHQEHPIIPVSPSQHVPTIDAVDQTLNKVSPSTEGFEPPGTVIAATTTRRGDHRACSVNPTVRSSASLSDENLPPLSPPLKQTMSPNCIENPERTDKALIETANSVHDNNKSVNSIKNVTTNSGLRRSSLLSNHVLTDNASTNAVPKSLSSSRSTRERNMKKKKLQRSIKTQKMSDIERFVAEWPADDDPLWENPETAAMWLSACPRIEIIGHTIMPNTLTPITAGLTAAHMVNTLANTVNSSVAASQLLCDTPIHTNFNNQQVPNVDINDSLVRMRRSSVPINMKSVLQPDANFSSMFNPPTSSQVVQMGHFAVADSKSSTDSISHLDVSKTSKIFDKMDSLSNCFHMVSPSAMTDAHIVCKCCGGHKPSASGEMADFTGIMDIATAALMRSTTYNLIRVEGYERGSQFQDMNTNNVNNNANNNSTSAVMLLPPVDGLVIYFSPKRAVGSVPMSSSDIRAEVDLWIATVLATCSALVTYHTVEPPPLAQNNINMHPYNLNSTAIDLVVDTLEHSAYDVYNAVGGQSIQSNNLIQNAGVNFKGQDSTLAENNFSTDDADAIVINKTKADNKLKFTRSIPASPVGLFSPDHIPSPLHDHQLLPNVSLYPSINTHKLNPQTPLDDILSPVRPYVSSPTLIPRRASVENQVTNSALVDNGADEALRSGGAIGMVDDSKPLRRLQFADCGEENTPLSPSVAGCNSAGGASQCTPSSRVHARSTFGDISVTSRSLFTSRMSHSVDHHHPSSLIPSPSIAHRTVGPVLLDISSKLGFSTSTGTYNTAIQNFSVSPVHGKINSTSPRRLSLDHHHHFSENNSNNNYNRKCHFDADNKSLFPGNFSAASINADTYRLSDRFLGSSFNNQRFTERTLNQTIPDASLTTWSTSILQRNEAIRQALIHQTDRISETVVLKLSCLIGEIERVIEVTQTELVIYGVQNATYGEFFYARYVAEQSLFGTSSKNEIPLESNRATNNANHKQSSNSFNESSTSESHPTCMISVDPSATYIASNACDHRREHGGNSLQAGGGVASASPTTLSQPFVGSFSIFNCGECSPSTPAASTFGWAPAPPERKRYMLISHMLSDFKSLQIVVFRESVEIQLSDHEDHLMWTLTAPPWLREVEVVTWLTSWRLWAISRGMEVSFRSEERQRPQKTLLPRGAAAFDSDIQQKKIKPSVSAVNFSSQPSVEKAKDHAAVSVSGMSGNAGSSSIRAPSSKRHQSAGTFSSVTQSKHNMTSNSNHQTGLDSKQRGNIASPAASSSSDSSLSSSSGDSAYAPLPLRASRSVSYRSTDNHILDKKGLSGVTKGGFTSSANSFSAGTHHHHQVNQPLSILSMGFNSRCYNQNSDGVQLNDDPSTADNKPIISAAVSKRSQSVASSALRHNQHNLNHGGGDQSSSRGVSTRNFMTDNNNDFKRKSSFVITDEEEKLPDLNDEIYASSRDRHRSQLPATTSLNSNSDFVFRNGEKIIILAPQNNNYNQNIQQQQSPVSVSSGSIQDNSPLFNPESSNPIVTSWNQTTHSSSNKSLKNASALAAPFVKSVLRQSSPTLDVSSAAPPVASHSSRSVRIETAVSPQHAPHKASFKFGSPLESSPVLMQKLADENLQATSSASKVAVTPECTKRQLTSKNRVSVIPGLNFAPVVVDSQKSISINSRREIEVVPSHSNNSQHNNGHSVNHSFTKEDKKHLFSSSSSSYSSTDSAQQEIGAPHHRIAIHKRSYSDFTPTSQSIGCTSSAVGSANESNDRSRMATSGNVGVLNPDFKDTSRSSLMYFSPLKNINALRALSTSTKNKSHSKQSKINGSSD